VSEDLSCFVDALEPGWMEAKERLLELRDELEAVRARLEWANVVLRKWQSRRAKRARDFFAARVLEITREIEALESNRS